MFLHIFDIAYVKEICKDFWLTQYIHTYKCWLMKDAVNSEDEATNMKLYAVCDLAMGIILTRNIIDAAAAGIC